MHTKWTIPRVVSFGITFRRESVKEAGVVFDERFGLGAKYVSGEENIFLKDCLNAGLKVIHVDEAIVQHEHESSGWVWDEVQVRTKVAVIWRLYGPLLVLPVMTLWSITKRALYKKHMSAFVYTQIVLGEYVRILRDGL